MSFGSRLKERREQLGITQIQLAEMLGVSKGAIGNYETGLNSPKATILYKVFEVLNCDANYLFQDEMIEVDEKAIHYEDYEEIVKKYIALDTHGKKVVDTVLDIEYERCVENKRIIEAFDNPEKLDLVARNNSLNSAELEKLIDVLNRK